MSNEQSKKEEKRIPRYLLEVLACPVTKTDLIYEPDNNRLISKTGGLIFEIKDGIPDMRVEHAKPYHDEGDK